MTLGSNKRIFKNFQLQRVNTNKELMSTSLKH